MLTVDDGSRDDAPNARFCCAANDQGSHILSLVVPWDLASTPVELDSHTRLFFGLAAFRGVCGENFPDRYRQESTCRPADVSKRLGPICGDYFPDDVRRLRTSASLVRLHPDHTVLLDTSCVEYLDRDKLFLN